MKVPVSWLKAYVDFEGSVEELTDALTFSGIEVEGVDTVGSDYAGMMVGEVTAVEPHPNADRLTLCTVNTGSGETRVVCGAPNVKVGARYPFAPVGSVLADGTKLKKAKIRGEISEGMLCAEDELGLSNDHSGVLELADDLVPGTPLSEVLGPPETVLDLEITPNRPDCHSIIGIAREVAALRGLKLRLPETPLKEDGPPVETLTRVDVEDSEGCPRYTARILTGIKIGPSPDWMQRRLTLAGIRPINNIVDITNYVMLESGEPLHAFDQSLLAEGRIVVRRARGEERMATLDDIERTFDVDTLLIADANGAVAVAGVMGGAGSEIRETTETVLLESASFDPRRIRAAAKRLGLSTESSYRFERGVDTERPAWASRRAAFLIIEYAGATAAPGMVDVYPDPPAPREIRCRFKRVQRLLGVPVDPEDIQAVFRGLELEVTAADDEGCTVRIPAFRGDLAIEVDLIEEVARIHGLDRIPAPPPRAELVPDADDTPFLSREALGRRLSGLGLREIMNYSYVSPELLGKVNTDDASRRVALPHPLSQDQSVLRSSLLPQMMDSLGRNFARQIREAGLFEMGTVYFLGEDGSPREEARVAVGLFGPAGRTGLDRRSTVSDDEMFLWIKGLWEALAEGQGLGPAKLAAVDTSCFEPGYSTEIRVGETVVGRLGLIRRKTASQWRMTEPVGVFEVRCEVLLEKDFKPAAIREVPAYPATTRDIALVVDAATMNADVLAIVYNNTPKDLENVALFDIFKGKGIGDGKKSMAYSFTYRSAERTLTDEEVNERHAAVTRALTEGLGAQVRES